jgi:hypothetical protein
VRRIAATLDVVPNLIFPEFAFKRVVEPIGARDPPKPDTTSRIEIFAGAIRRHRFRTRVLKRMRGFDDCEAEALFDGHEHRVSQVAVLFEPGQMWHLGNCRPDA